MTRGELQHKVLLRQLRRLKLSTETPPDADSWSKFLHAINQSYGGHDQDRYLMERSLEISSNEMQELLSRQKNASENVIHSILQNTPAIISIKDEIGHYVLVNRRFETVFNITQNELAGKTPFDLFPEEIAAEHLQNDHAVLVNNKPVEIEERAPCEDGIHTYLTIKFPIHDLQSDSHLVCGISTDITQRIKSEEQLRQVHKMDALGNLTGGVAHDFNNLLAIILGYSDLLELELMEHDDSREYVNEIRQATIRGMHLTKSLLAFSRRKRAEAKRVNIHQLLKGSRKMLTQTLTPRIELTVHSDPELWDTSLDHDELQDALVNMAINAMHAIEDRGSLEFIAKNTALADGEAHALKLQPGDYVQLSIIDSGSGMSRETQARLFEPFFTTKGEKGTGLGLSRVYGFVKRSNGSIQVHSEPGDGSRFDLFFPRCSGRQSEASAQHRTQAAAGGGETILIVDDEPALLKSTHLMLSSNGYSVTSAKSGQQALDLLAQMPIDLMITDVLMPEMSGFELADEVTKRYPKVKIQLASGFTDQSNTDDTTDEFDAPLLTKPFTSHTLLVRVRELLDE